MILCCGEALIDMIPETTVSGDACFVPKAGGAVFNTAIALGRLSSNVAMFTGVSNDFFGTVLQDEMRASGVETSYLAIKDAPSTLAFVQLLDRQARYTFYSENAADTTLEKANWPSDLDSCDTLFFGGISLCTDPTASTMQDLMHARANDSVLMIDPNIRPSFISDEASYRARLLDMIGLCDILKISDEDLDWLVPDTPDLSRQITKLTGDTNKLVFVTKGAAGGLAFLGAQQVSHAKATPVKVADTIGAGDTFNAGILHMFEQEGVLTKSFLQAPDIDIISKALNFAVKLAGITVSRQGANPPWLREL